MEFVASATVVEVVATRMVSGMEPVFRTVNVPVVPEPGPSTAVFIAESVPVVMVAVAERTVDAEVLAVPFQSA
ncbi:hypothetical protein GCM10017714_00370 [Curtobacterium pusillum]|nr:hypothetical protein GCM10017610_17560 [Curtobacterium pusillum]